jgi:RNA polymerase sigma-70 factor (ECF subfamily)
MAIGNEVFGRIWALEPAREADWDALYADQMPRVYNYFRYRVRDGAVAQDLTSLTFEKAWVARNRYRRDLAGFSTWLMTIARNVAIDHYRRRRDHAPLEAADHVAAGDDPLHELERRESFEKLSRLLNALPERDSELVSLATARNSRTAPSQSN